MSNAFLAGHRVHLRPVEEDDLPRCQRWVNDPDIRRTTRMAFPLDAKAERAWWESQPRGPRSSAVNLAICVGDLHIGNTGLMGISWIDRRAMSGTIIGEKQEWGKGYATEAKWLLLKYAFFELGLRRVESEVFGFNAASLKHLEANGYVEEGRKIEAVFCEGAFHDEVILAVTPERFRASRAWAKHELGGGA